MNRAIFLGLICLLLGSCDADPSTTAAPNTPASPRSSSQGYAILYLAEEILDIHPDSTQAPTSYAIALTKKASWSLGTYQLNTNKVQGWTLVPVDQSYPFSVRSPLSLDPTNRLGLQFQDTVDYQHLFSIAPTWWVVPSQLSTDHQFISTFAATPQIVAQHQWLRRQLPGLLAK